MTPEINFTDTMQYIANVIQTLAPNDSIERFTALGARSFKILQDL